MKNKTDFTQLLEKGADHYISLLRDNDLYEEIIVRIKKKNATEPVSLIKQLFANQLNFAEYLFSDLNFSFDYFYEGMENNLKRAIDLSFKNLAVSYHLYTEFHHRQTKALERSIQFESEEAKDQIDPNRFAELMNSCEVQWRVVVTQQAEKLEFIWISYDAENLINFLNFLNDICKRNDSGYKWFPIASADASSFIFTTPKRYDSILELSLMPPEGFKIDEYAVVYYPQGIRETSNKTQEILPTLNISCEVEMGKKEKVIEVKLWRKANAGNLEIEKVSDLILKKLTSLSSVCNKMNWAYGKIILDANKILSEQELKYILETFTAALQRTVEQKEIELEGKEIVIFSTNLKSANLRSIKY
ncbi:MAG: hypothetical protein AB8G15_18420 [Saprospiraceae bacterium]